MYMALVHCIGLLALTELLRILKAAVRVNFYVVGMVVALASAALADVHLLVPLGHVALVKLLPWSAASLLL